MFFIFARPPATRPCRAAGEAGGGHLSGAGMNVTFLDQSGPEWNSRIMLLRNRLMRAIWFAETLRRTFSYSPQGLTSSSSRPYRNFSKGESFPNKFSSNLTLQKLCQHFFHQITTPPWSSWQQHFWAPSSLFAAATRTPKRGGVKILYFGRTKSATYCNTLQHTTTHRNTPQHTTTHCNTLSRESLLWAHTVWFNCREKFGHCWERLGHFRVRKTLLQKSPVKKVSFAKESYKRDDIHNSREKSNVVWETIRCAHNSETDSVLRKTPLKRLP